MFWDVLPRYAIGRAAIFYRKRCTDETIQVLKEEPDNQFTAVLLAILKELASSWRFTPSQRTTQGESTQSLEHANGLRSDNQ